MPDYGVLVQSLMALLYQSSREAGIRNCVGTASNSTGTRHVIPVYFYVIMAPSTGGATFHIVVWKQLKKRRMCPSIPRFSKQCKSLSCIPLQGLLGGDHI
uniref:Uncharacterized protein n=1 Tax=Sphaerodactylus townsendi TaxID=933632 RepID=A0ACB8G4J7_9SAUR